MVFHLYIVFAKRRDQLLKYCLKGLKLRFIIQTHVSSEEFKIFKNIKGDFPITDRHTKEIITFPCDQHLSKKQLNYVIKTVKDFYKYK